MALTKTTASAAIAVSDTKINLTSLTGLAAGNKLKIDGEVFIVDQAYAGVNPFGVLRGQEGTYNQAHESGATAVFGPAADWGGMAPGTVSPFPMARPETQTSYTAAGAIALPLPGADALAQLNGTTILAMTLAAPTKDLEGSTLTVLGNGKAAHTITVDGSVGIGDAGASYNVLTFDANGRNGFVFRVVNSMWVLLSAVTGTATAIEPAVS